MRRRALLLVVPALALGTVFAPGAMSRPQAPPALEVKLERIKEMRVADIVPSDDNMNMFEQPALELRFAVKTPAGRTIVEFGQPGEITATDSTGTDLTKVEENVFGRQDFVTTEMTWDEAPTAFTVKLALPARAAETFSLSATMSALTYESTDEIMLTPGDDWQVVEGLAAPDGAAVKAKLTRQRDMVQLDMMPGTVREAIESAELIDGGSTLESQGSMWNDQSISYMFSGTPGAGAKAKLVIRKGAAQVPIKIQIEGQELP